jgi:hypothetical protein
MPFEALATASDALKAHRRPLRVCPDGARAGVSPGLQKRKYWYRSNEAFVQAQFGAPQNTARTTVHLASDTTGVYMTDDESRGFLSASAEELSLRLAEMEKDLEAPSGSLTTLPHQDDWSVVIKCHALVEGAVSGMLSAALDARLRKIFNLLELGKEDTGKLEFAKALGMLTPEQRAFVRELSKMRNLLAHDLRHLNFTLNAYLGSLPTADRRKQFVDALCFGLDPAKQNDWHTAIRASLKTGVLSAVIRLIVHAIQTGAFAAIDKEESQIALKDMISGRLRYSDQFDDH